jgi:hypothetical protein
VVVVACSVFVLHAGSHSSLAVNSFYRFSSTGGRRNGMSQIFETSKRWAVPAQIITVLRKTLTVL